MSTSRFPNRIPSMDFRGQKFVNEDGTLTDVAQSFFDLLNTVLTKTIGSEGVVPPTQTDSNITVIQNNFQTSPTGTKTYTCGFGTIIYNETLNKGVIALNDGSGLPVFKQIITT